MVWQKFYSKSPSSQPGLHDTIHSGKDTNKHARSSDLSRGQSKDSCPNMRLRICSKVPNKASIQKNQPSHAIIHGRTKLATLTPTHTPRTQLLPRHGTLTLTVTRSTMQNSLNEKYMHNESAPWSARYHPFGEGHGNTGMVFGPLQGSEHGLQILANKELQMQIHERTR